MGEGEREADLRVVRGVQILFQSQLWFQGKPTPEGFTAGNSRAHLFRFLPAGTRRIFCSGHAQSTVQAELPAQTRFDRLQLPLNLVHLMPQR